MRIFEVFVSALKNLSSNKLRSGLTMLGVIIGVAAVIAMSSIVEGGKKLMVDMMEQMGTNLLFVNPKKLSDEEMRNYSGRSNGLRFEDPGALKVLIPTIDAISPVASGEHVFRFEEKDVKGMVQGVGPDYQRIRNYVIDRGRFVDNEDVSRFARVVVLGKDVRKKLFGEKDPIGRDVKIGDDRFIVIGTMKRKGSLHGANFDDKAFVPVTTFLKLFKGTDRINYFIAKVGDRSKMRETEEGVRFLLARRHDGVEDFSIRNQNEFLNATERIILTFQAILGGIAALSLLVGGIGIMNIMLVTVTERTGEIGLRKAVGATRWNILFQFLVESVTISLVGGGIGVALGALLGLGFGYFMGQAITGWNAVILPGAILLGFFFSIAVGVFFGLYPAHKASRLDPAEALRYQ